ncbi:OLC1v1005499C1 [Oldenlandia corymbosa var. corymbosa]|uniref:OLC1v1005499C1 n=1 Tax=Oldenlandia corymbosa var. corymbosa TaxID=529605 RepID=A0AAV1DES1_OLDCO|nr:OLC1v1005499C1 [Oldenlandia corymbosa var. corymbosa]
MAVSLMLLECIGNEESLNSLSQADWKDVIEMVQKQMLEPHRNLANWNLKDYEEADHQPSPRERVDPDLSLAPDDAEKLKGAMETRANGDAPSK